MINQIRMGEYIVGTIPCSIKCLGIGSAVIIYLYDDIYRVYGCAHVIFGEYNDDKITRESQKNKYASIVLDKMIKEMKDKGAKKIKAKICGACGIKVMGSNKIIDGNSKLVPYIKTKLLSENIVLEAQDLGGISGRCIVVNTDLNKINIQYLNEQTNNI